MKARSVYVWGNVSLQKRGNRYELLLEWHLYDGQDVSNVATGMSLHDREQKLPLLLIKSVACQNVQVQISTYKSDKTELSITGELCKITIKYQKGS